VKTAFQTIEAKIARRWLNPTPVVLLDSTILPTNDDNKSVEGAVQYNIERLGFMLRAPLVTAITSIVWTVSAPIWVFMPKSRTCHISIKALQQQYNDRIVQPWLEGLSKEGEKSLLGVIKLSSDAARGTLNSALEREEIRYTRELETKKKPLDDTTVDNLVTAFVNLLAAEEALQELYGRIGRK
jgi:hypothetical protein